ncbi:MAG: hypothetical protein Q7T87_07355 [Polaromonas sp.]|nr:hypothetical protein [Polaromonas sp.]
MLSLSKASWFQGNGINPYIWCLVGAVLGGLACFFKKSAERSVMIENVAVGVFGAYIGGDFLSAMIPGATGLVTDFSMRSLGLAVASGTVFLLALGLMRRKVGPMHVTKGPRRRD